MVVCVWVSVWEHILQLIYSFSTNSFDSFDWLILARAVFCVIGRCDPTEDHSEVADKIDDYLWIKFSQIQVDLDPSRQDGFTLQRLQSLLYEDFGKLCLVPEKFHNHCNQTRFV